MNTDEAFSRAAKALDKYRAIARADWPARTEGSLADAWSEYLNAKARYLSLQARDADNAYDAWPTRSE